MAIAVTQTAERSAQAVVYSWTYGAPGGVKPEVAASVVEAIYAEQGAVTPEAVLEQARSEDAPLHPAFEWDDAVAAEAHRQDQARSLLRRLTVSYRRTDGSLTTPTRYVVKLLARADEDDPEDEALAEATQPHIYLPVRRVMSDEVLRRKYVREAYLSVVSWRRRYRDVAEFARLFEAIDAMGDDFGKAS